MLAKQYAYLNSIGTHVSMLAIIHNKMACSLLPNLFDFKYLDNLGIYFNFDFYAL